LIAMPLSLRHVRSAAQRVALALVPLALAACVSPENDRLTVGHGPAAYRPEAMTPDSGRAGNTTPGVEPSARLPQSAQSTLTGLDRSNWSRTTITVPVDGTAHRPTYLQRVLGTNSSARQRRDFPTADTSLELTQGSGQDQALEAPLQHAQAAWDFVLGVPRMFFQLPYRTRWSADESYQRAWRQPPLRAKATDPTGSMASPEPVRLTP
jgi:hypothetical protein